VLSSGGTGNFYSLAVWRSVAGAPIFTSVGDRNPVVAITIAGQKATVVYLTRTEDLPPIAVNIKRTVVHKLSGSSLVELSHIDAPYTP